VTHPLDIFRNQAALQADCSALYPGDATEQSACVQLRTGSAQAEIFGLLIGGAIGLLIGRFVLSGRK
jgi:hypothetical protein